MNNEQKLRTEIDNTLSKNEIKIAEKYIPQLTFSQCGRFGEDNDVMKIIVNSGKEG